MQKYTIFADFQNSPSFTFSSFILIVKKIPANNFFYLQNIVNQLNNKI